ncbi:NADP-dependent oxidoreductase [Dictyobacter arantiisoli]|uniref:NADPH:quinone reductase n=1 Tax=Dictyobacter arantiisoli TaxID=2014874 RepID=A0A5A5TGT2_9CHLR|nr:NADP-dependent oxidoreductase [Dictyobacter arantiisoli]GCF10164.1 NADPH:quinone reductase [Dictyobacter arantiisoli]
MSTETSQTMKAIQIHTFGGPEVLVYKDVPRPVAGPGEVLIRVFAAGLYPGDWYFRSGFANVPEAVRRVLQQRAISLPFIPGSQASGIVEAVGPGVTAFHRGDAVYGLLRFPGGGSPAGAYAEYITAPVEHLALKPASIDHLQAAAVPMAALTVWQGIMEHTNLQAGQTVLVNGAAGGTGHIAVQLAKARGARVIGVASGRHEAFLRALGVDVFVDYTTTSLEQVAHEVDVAIDTVGAMGENPLLVTLKRGGTLLWIGLHSMNNGVVIETEHTEAGVTIEKFQVRSNGAHLAAISELIDTGQLRVIVDTVVPLAEAPKAHERGEAGHLQGIIVLRVAEEGRGLE